MKALMINGSPHKNGNTSIALRELERVFAQEGVETETLWIGNQAIRGCIGCNTCFERGRCVFDDAVNAAAPLFEAADGLVVATPVYYAAANGTLVSFLDRLFYSTRFDKRMKVGAAVAVARRAGTTSAMDDLNRYFLISGMPIAASQYWNGAFGREQGDIERDEEGKQILRTLARNMAFLMKSVALGKETYGLPETETHLWTHFIR